MTANNTQPQTNIERLLKHLKQGSLAQRLVDAHCSPGDRSPIEAARAVLRTRLEQVRAELDNPKA